MSVSVMAGRAGAGLAVSPVLVRVLFLLAVAGAAAAGLLLAGDGSAAADPDLTRLLRAMALLKAIMAAGLAAAILWRLGSAVSPVRFASYAIASGAAAAGPGLIWGMSHVVSGAALLHGGLLAGVLLLWRDPAVSHRLAVLVAARRARPANARRS